MQHHAFWYRATSCVGSLRIDMAAKSPIAVARSPCRSDRAVGVGIEGLKGHEALEGHRVGWGVGFDCLF